MTIKILKIEPGKKPEIKEIEDGLKSLQNEVQGEIEAVYPFFDNVGIICNEEGKINGMALNRALYDRRTMAKLIRQHESAKLPGDGEWHGFRADTDTYSYLFRMQANPGDYNFYCYCYKKDWLDSHMQNAERGLRFITPDYETKFILPDGGKIKIAESDGETSERTCRYVDEYHLETSASKSTGWNLWHICEFAERMEQNGNKVEPVTEPIHLINVRYYCPLILSVFERNEYGDLENECYDYDGHEAARYEDEIRSLIEGEHSYDGCDARSMATYRKNPKVRAVQFDVDEGIATIGFRNCENSYFMKNENEFRQYLNQNNVMKMGGM